LEPIFEADLPPEIYAYRAGRNAQQAAVAVEELLFRGHPEGPGRPGHAAISTLRNIVPTSRSNRSMAWSV
jgi:hypothetical protein